MHNVVVSRALDHTSIGEAKDTAQMRILIADGHDLVRETIGMCLEAEGVTEIVCVGDLDATIEATHSIDLALLDFNMPGINGLQGLARMKEANDGRPVAILSETAAPQIAKDAIAAGAVGFVPRTPGAKSMVPAIHSVAAGETVVPHEFMRQVETKTVANLPERETDVLRGLCEGKLNQEIASDLDLQEVTIKLHVKTLCRKLDAKNRTPAAVIARDRNLL